MTSSTTTRTQRELAARLRLGVMRLARRLRQQAEHGVTPSMLSALSSIERLGPLTLGRLAEVERVQPPTLTKIVARLESEGLVTRETDAGDHRVARVRLSRRGRDLVQRARLRKDEYLAAKLARLSPDELGALESAIGAIEHMLEEED
jgi:DNA-binding MarR family transcriptional regulator